MRVLVTGKNGFIGSNLIKKLQYYGYDTYGVGRDDFDLTDREQTNQWFENKDWDIVIHTAIVGGSRLKEDSKEVFFDNLSMFYNLIANKDKFSQLISFGSGAERYNPTDPYGLSKNIINRIIKGEPQFNNIRIYGVFGEDEWDTRFIKANIKRYINKQPLVIHQNKFMDFIYIDDLILLVHYVIQNIEEKLIEANYIQPYSLNDIALLINNLGYHKCEIKIENNKMGEKYRGGYNHVKLPYIGLERGIKKVYNKLIECH